MQPFTKDQAGLGNVDNTSDANKPVSTAQQPATTNGSPDGQGAVVTVPAGGVVNMGGFAHAGTTFVSAGGTINA